MMMDDYDVDINICDGTSNGIESYFHQKTAIEMKYIDLENIDFLRTRPMQASIGRKAAKIIGAGVSGDYKSFELDVRTCEWPPLEYEQASTTWLLHHLFFPCTTVMGSRAKFLSKDGSYDMFGGLSKENQSKELHIADKVGADVGGLVHNFGIHKRVGVAGSTWYDWPYITRSKSGTHHCEAIFRVGLYTHSDSLSGKFQGSIPPSQYAVHISLLTYLGHTQSSMVSDIMLRGEARECKACSYQWVFNPQDTDETKRVGSFSPDLRYVPRKHPKTKQNLFAYSGQCRGKCSELDCSKHTYYCSRTCQKQDWKRHQREDGCCCLKKKQDNDWRPKRRYKHVRGANRVRIIVQGPHDATIEGKRSNYVTVFDAYSLEQFNVKTAELNKLLKCGSIEWMSDIKDTEAEGLYTRARSKQEQQKEQKEATLKPTRKPLLPNRKSTPNPLPNRKPTYCDQTNIGFKKIKKTGSNKVPFRNSRDVLKQHIAVEKQKKKKCKTVVVSKKPSKPGADGKNNGTKKNIKKKKVEVPRDFLHHLTYRQETYEERMARTTVEKKQHAEYMKRRAGQVNVGTKVVTSKSEKKKNYEYINTHDSEMRKHVIRTRILQEVLKEANTRNILVNVGLGTHANSRGEKGVMRDYLLALHQRWHASEDTSSSNMGTSQKFTFKEKMIKAFGTRRRTFKVKEVQWDGQYDRRYLWIQLLT